MYPMQQSTNIIDVMCWRMLVDEYKILYPTEHRNKVIRNHIAAPPVYPHIAVPPVNKGIEVLSDGGLPVEIISINMMTIETMAYGDRYRFAFRDIFSRKDDGENRYPLTMKNRGICHAYIKVLRQSWV